MPTRRCRRLASGLVSPKRRPSTARTPKKTPSFTPGDSLPGSGPTPSTRPFASLDSDVAMAERYERVNPTAMTAPATEPPASPRPPGKAANPRVYAAVREVLAFALRCFYRIDRVGPPLPDGPVVLVGNHPNALIDPGLLIAV